MQVAGKDRIAYPDEKDSLGMMSKTNDAAMKLTSNLQPYPHEPIHSQIDVRKADYKLL